MSNPISADDLQAIHHINYVANSTHSLTDDLYEDLMDRDHEEAKIKAKNITKDRTANTSTTCLVMD